MLSQGCQSKSRDLIISGRIDVRRQSVATGTVIRKSLASMQYADAPIAEIILPELIPVDFVLDRQGAGRGFIYAYPVK
jgi:hypothetical protein